MWVQIIYNVLRYGLRNFFQDVGCDDTDISEDIDLEVHIQLIVPTLEQFHCLIYVRTFLICSFIFILISKYIILHFISVFPS